MIDNIEDEEEGGSVRDKLNRVIFRANSYGPFASTTEAKALLPEESRYDGLTVKINGSSELYWWEAPDLSDAGLKVKAQSSFSLPLKYYVYLVNDAQDAIGMGGTAKNTYTTFQAAGDAAFAIITLFPTALVVIRVGVASASIVGNFVVPGGRLLPSISIVGISSKVSEVGSITLGGTTSNLTTTNVQFKSIKVGDLINVNGSGNVLVAEDAVFGNINNSVGGINFQFRSCCNVRAGNITLVNSQPVSSGSTGLVLGNVTVTGTGGGVQINLPGISPTLTSDHYSVIMNSLTFTTSTSVSNIYLNGLHILTTLTVNAITNNASFITGSNLTIEGAVYVNYSGGSGTAKMNLVNSVIRGTINFTVGQFLFTAHKSILCRLINLPANSVLVNTELFDSSDTTPLVNGIGANCEFYLCSFIGGTLAIDNASPVEVKFNSGNSIAKSEMGANITLT